MNPRVIFPVILIVLDVCASIVYGYFGDWKQMVYWFAAATLTVCVTI